MRDNLLDKIIKAIEHEKSKNPPCGTALSINDKLWQELGDKYPDLKYRLGKVDVFIDKSQVEFIVENWEYT
jgi:hypothetical protein